MEDLIYFAENAYLPFDAKNGSSAKDAPWVLIGGSYSGALAAWIEALRPGTFWAYHATSAPVQAIGNYVCSRAVHGAEWLLTIDSGNTSFPSKKPYPRTARETSRASSTTSTRRCLMELLSSSRR